MTPLGFVAEDERCRVNALGWETLADVARVNIDGVEGDANRGESFG